MPEMQAAAQTPTQAPSAKPNVLFIVVDDLRPDLGCYGNIIIKTPNIDRLAARSVQFNRAYCQQAVCSPSRTALLTGLRPDTTKVWDLKTHFRAAVPDAITLPQYFKANGYHTASLSKIYHGGYEDGQSWSEPAWMENGNLVDTDPADWSKRIIKRISPGVDEYLVKPKRPDAAEEGASAKGAPYEVSVKPDEQLPDGFTAREAVKRLASYRTNNTPFFLAVGFRKPHLPFVAPKKYWDMYDPNTIPTPTIDHLPTGSPEYAGHVNGELHQYQGVPEGNPIPPDLAKTLRHGYYASISYTDAQIGLLLDALDQNGLADNTIIVLWGDHGWQLGDHGLWHKHTNFELAARIPLLISIPGAPSAGRASDTPVETIDIYPTLAELCGLPAPKSLDGTTLKPLLDNPATPSDRVAISQYPRAGRQTGNRNLMGYSLRDKQWRLTLWRDRDTNQTVATELYDELNDPTETASVAHLPANAATVEQLTQRLMSIIPTAAPMPSAPAPTK